MLRRTLWYGLILSLIIAGVCTISPLSAAAAPDANPIAVNSTVDNTIPGDGWCTLREALNNANANADTTAGDCAAGSAVTIDAINLPAGIYQLKTGFDNSNVGGDLDVYSGGGSVRFAGASATNTIIQGPGYVVGTDRIIHAGADEPGPITVEVKRLTLRQGHAPQGGGAVYANGVTLVIEDSVLDQCTATFGGGMSNNGNGGGVYLATGSVANIRRSTIADNKARSVVVGSAAGGGFYVASGSRLTLDDSYVLRNDVSAIAGPHVNSFGGGIYNVDGGIVKINRSQVVSNTASSMDSPVAYGGGIVNFGSMDVWDTLIAENTANGSAGGMLHSGTSTIIGRSTLARNQALEGNAGGLQASTTLYIVNSTFSGNTARYSAGGIEISSPTPVEFEYVTITDNTGDSDHDGVGGVGGVMVYLWSAAPLVYNTIIAGNHDNMPADQAYPDVSGPFTSQGHNLIGDGTGSSGFTNGVNGDIAGTRAAPVNARLRPLADNGGYTPTHLPRWNSRSVDRGGASLQTNDQRKRVRPCGLAPDIGAVELNYLMLPDLRKTP